MNPAARAIVAATLLSAAPAIYALVATDLKPVPVPNLAEVEVSIAEQLTALQADLATTLQETPLEPAVLLLAYAELGQTYLTYSLLEPGVAALENAMLLDPQDFRWPYLLARVAQETNDPETAADLLTRVLEIDPVYLPALIRFGELELRNQSLDSASVWYRKALDLAPGSPVANYGLAQIALRQGRPEEAVALFEEVLEQQPSASAVHYTLGIAYRDLGDLAKAREHLALRGEIGVQAYDPLADSLAQRVRGASLYITRGNLALIAGNHELAIRAYGKAVAATPDNRVAIQGLANSYAHAGQADRAISLYQQVLEASPDDSVILYNLGTLLSEAGREREAESALQRALEITPELTNARFNLALMREQQGDWTAALDQYEAILALEPEDLEVAVRRASALARLGRAHAARTELTSVLVRDPGMGSAYIALGATYELENDSTGAEHSYRQGIAKAADDAARAQAAFALGNLLRESRPKEAIEAFTIASRAAPGVAAARFSLALVLGREGRFDEAARAYDSGLAIDPDNSQAHVGRAMSLLLAGQDSRALLSLERSLARAADSITLSHLLARLLATSPDASVRDAGRALTLAREIMRTQPSLDHGETLAMALAEAGQFAQAVAVQEQVRQQALATGRTEALSLIEQRLELYGAGDPVRSPWNG